MKHVLAAIAAVALTCTAFSQAKPAKNVIIMVGDGMGYNQILAGSLYRFGEEKRQIYWREMGHLPITTFSDNNKQGYPADTIWTDFKLFHRVPSDSSAAATAISTGYKCPNARVGMDREGRKLPHMLYDAEALGKSTGVVSSVRLTHATPASFVTYDVGRGNEADIARKMFADSPLDLVIAPGHPLYDNDAQLVDLAAVPAEEREKRFKSVGGEALWAQLQAGTVGGDANGDGVADAWTLLDNTPAIVALAETPRPERILGLVPVQDTLQLSRGGENVGDAYAVPQTEGLPTLSQMARAALAQLSQDPDGFFVMIEGGAIDWGGHSNLPGRLIEEQIDFDRAVEDVVDWVQRNSNWEETMLFVTADHEAGYLLGPGSDPDWKPLVNNGPAKMPGMEFHSKQHTNQLVPVFYKGAGTAKITEHIHGTDPRLGPYADNTDISKVIRAAWGVPIPELSPVEPKPE